VRSDHLRGRDLGSPGSPMRVKAARTSPLLIVLAFGCSASEPEPAGSFQLSALEREVFATSCALSESCHRGGVSKENLNLEAPVHDKIVGKSSHRLPTRILVVPGAAAESYLFEKVTSNEPSAGERMPVGQPLPPALIERIRAWIDAGAPDD
jgi:hypothetical protein